MMALVTIVNIISSITQADGALNQFISDDMVVRCKERIKNVPAGEELDQDIFAECSQ